MLGAVMGPQKLPHFEPLCAMPTLEGVEIA